jgi:hypothetical protein
MPFRTIEIKQKITYPECGLYLDITRAEISVVF